MSKHIQIRDVPEETHRKLKALAAAQGLSMSAYLKRLIERDLKRPDWPEMTRRLDQSEPVDLGDEIVKAIREDRDSR